MAKTVQQWLDEYGESHQNPINKAIHWLCVPLIMISLIGLLWPINLVSNINLGVFLIAFATIYYLSMSFKMFLGMAFVGFGLVSCVNYLDSFSSPLWQISLSIFILAWIGQFIGHKIEGKKPSFLKDIQFLLIGPAWLLGFIYKKNNIKI